MDDLIGQHERLIKLQDRCGWVDATLWRAGRDEPVWRCWEQGAVALQGWAQETPSVMLAAAVRLELGVCCWLRGVLLAG